MTLYQIYLFFDYYLKIIKQSHQHNPTVEQAALAYENEMRAWMKEEGSKGEGKKG